MKLQKTAETVGVLANANELVRLTMLQLVGNELASAIEGSEINRNVLYSMTQSRIQAGYASVLGK